jgi:DNA-binding winged helix-turn-helix (wHTH) protein
VLCELARRPGRVVTKEELFRACWPATAVSQTVLRVCIREIRVALAEDAPASVALETVGRRGYRLVTAAETTELPPDPLVGRDRELSVLRRALVGPRAAAVRSSSSEASAASARRRSSSTSSRRRAPAPGHA